MCQELIKAKVAEIKEGLARKTGVNLEDVEKILDNLGLESALYNRHHVEQNAKRYSLDTALPLQNVSVDNIRIAAGDMHI